MCPLSFKASGATPANLLVASMASELFSSTYLSVNRHWWGLKPGSIIPPLPHSVRPGRCSTDWTMPDRLFLWSLLLLSVNIKLNSLRINLEVLSLSLSFSLNVKLTLNWLHVPPCSSSPEKNLLDEEMTDLFKCADRWRYEKRDKCMCFWKAQTKLSSWYFFDDLWLYTSSIQPYSRQAKLKEISPSMNDKCYLSEFFTNTGKPGKLEKFFESGKSQKISEKMKWIRFASMEIVVFNSFVED